MIFSSVALWETVVDLLGLGLCGLTALYLLGAYLRKGRGKKGIDRKAKGRIKAPEAVSAHQGGKGSFEQIMEAQKQERGLSHARRAEKGSEKAPPVYRSGVRGKAQVWDMGTKAFGARRDRMKGRRGEIMSLVDLGVDIEDIAERAGVQKGEVDLIMKLKRAEYGSGEMDQKDIRVLV